MDIDEVIVGQAVHYVAYNGQCLAAIVLNENPNESCDLAVLTALPNVNGTKNGGIQFHFNIDHSDAANKKPGTWHFMHQRF